VAERIKLSPDLLAVWRGIQEHKTPTQIGNALGFSRAWANKLLDRLVGYGLVFRAGDIPEDADMTRDYPWHAVADAPILPPGATLHVEYVTESQRDLRVKPVTRVRWQSWDIQGVPFLRPDGLRPKEQTPEQVIVVVTELVFTDEWEFRASIRRRWHESDTRRELGAAIQEPMIPDMTRAIAAALGVQALMDLTGKDLVQ
jgi:hypothetical protein